VATPTSERGWWPTRRSRREPPAEKVRLPDSFELEVTVDVKNLCLFWRRRDDDALGIFGSRAEVGRPVTVAHAWAAAALLKEIGEAGALRLAKRIEVQCFQAEVQLSGRLLGRWCARFVLRAARAQDRRARGAATEPRRRPAQGTKEEERRNPDVFDVTRGARAATS